MLLLCNLVILCVDISLFGMRDFRVVNEVLPKLSLILRDLSLLRVSFLPSRADATMSQTMSSDDYSRSFQSRTFLNHGHNCSVQCPPTSIRICSETQQAKRPSEA